MAWTNLGKERMFEDWFEASATAPTSFSLHAVTSGAGGADIPAASSVALSGYTEVTGANGYSAIPVTRGGSASGFLVTSGVDFALATLTGNYQLSADGGPISDIHYFLLCDGPEVAPASREVYAFWSTGSDLDLGAGTTLSISATLQGT